MSDMGPDPVEQLWYTWSDVGLSTIHAGFRVRAASPGLTEIYSERVKSMDRHLRYSLPPGTDRFAITPEMAPVCLAFIRTNWQNEYILVHKSYTGEDGVGRLGNFFVHAFALGENTHYFPPENAIWLWNSDIWRKSDQGQDRRSNALPSISLTELDNHMRFSPHYAQIRKYLPFLIEAYLSRKDRSTPLYIAAPAHQLHMIAWMIAGLTYCLPRQLQTDLTFSTYEPDVTKASTEIVGTSWIDLPGKEGEGAHVFPAQFYREKLAINCYTGEQSIIRGHPQTVYRPLAAEFADYAAECLATNNTEQLDMLYDLAEKSQSLDNDLFLQLFNDEVYKPDSTGEAGIIKYLNDPDLRIEKLSSRNFRKKIIDCVAANPQWGDNQLRDVLVRLREQAQREYASSLSHGQMPRSGYVPSDETGTALSALSQGPGRRNKKKQSSTQAKKNQITLTDALSKLAERAIPDVVDAMKKRTGTLDEQQKSQIAGSLLELMYCCLVFQDPNGVWRQLFDAIVANRNATDFLATHWERHAWLLQRWSPVFPVDPAYDQMIRSVLFIPWSRLGEFLTLGVQQRHPQWHVIAAERLASDHSLTPQIAAGLEQQSGKLISDLFALLVRDGQPETSTSFVMRLFEKGYAIKPPLTSHIDALLTQLFQQTSWHAARDLIMTLTQRRYIGNESYQERVERILASLLVVMPVEGLNLCDLLIAHHYPRKVALVDILLHSRAGGGDLERILQHIYPTPEELTTFFLTDGARYLTTPEQIKAMLSLYQQLLTQPYWPQKLECLSVLLNVLDVVRDEATILSLIQSTPLDGNELAGILQRCGKKYLEAFQHAPQLAEMVVERFVYLCSMQYRDISGLLLALFTPATRHEYLERLLSSARLQLHEIRTFFKEYGNVPRCFPFFRRSKTSLAFFAQLARAAHERAGGEPGRQLSAEKMELLLAWFDPSNNPLPEPEIAETFLRHALLTPTEQRAFLERYGESYLSAHPSPMLKEYIPLYVSEFNVDSLERAAAKNFLLFLARDWQRLSLDSTNNTIQRWYIISDYFDHPTPEPETLKRLVGALYKLALPDSTHFTVKLANTFASCVQSHQDLNTIMAAMQGVSQRIPPVQLLYILAEQAAALHGQQQNDGMLLPYILYILLGQREEYVLQMFLDRLFRNVAILDIKHWRTVNELLTGRALSPEILATWQKYLGGLRLLDELGLVAAGNEGGVQKSPSWLRGWGEYWQAQKELKRALRSRNIDRIAKIWEQRRKTIEDFPIQILKLRKKQRDKITVACRFVDMYKNMRKIYESGQTFDKSYLHVIDEMDYDLSNYRLTLKKEKREFVERVKIQIAASTHSGQDHMPINYNPPPDNRQTPAINPLSQPDMHATDIPLQYGVQPGPTYTDPSGLPPSEQGGMQFNIEKPEGKNKKGLFGRRH